MIQRGWCTRKAYTCSGWLVWLSGKSRELSYAVTNDTPSRWRVGQLSKLVVGQVSWDERQREIREYALRGYVFRTHGAAGRSQVWWRRYANGEPVTGRFPPKLSAISLLMLFVPMTVSHPRDNTRGTRQRDQKGRDKKNKFSIRNWFPDIRTLELIRKRFDSFFFQESMRNETYAIWARWKNEVCPERKSNRKQTRASTFYLFYFRSTWFPLKLWLKNW